jgi:septum site-determining protein MinC
MVTEEVNGRLKIQGLRNGLLVRLDGVLPWPEERSVLMQQLEEQASFFAGARLAIDVGERSLSAAEVGALIHDLKSADIALWALLSHSNATQENARNYGLEVALPEAKGHEQDDAAFDTLLRGEKAALSRRTLRSGFRLMSSGHVIVQGDVNPGAEVYAGGDIIVLGSLRGGAFAGVHDNTQAKVYALKFAPMQLFIADHRYEGSSAIHKSGPVVAQWADGSIVLLPWSISEK